MLTDILHDEGPLTGLTPVNVHGAVYTETIIVVQVENDARGAAEQLNVLLTRRVELQNPSYIYLDIFCEGNVSKARPRFLFDRRHFFAPSTLNQPPDKVAENYILIYRGGREALFIGSPWVGGWGWAAHAQAPKCVGWKLLPGTSEETMCQQSSKAFLACSSNNQNDNWETGS